ncbi:hypothetical protein A6R68_14830 [Neotoma lepida]|uniref:Uncharacterized protein n=1 Tax=Neotoma lepida TaxID=56216 RepID=A0A1A6H7P8_NEOLE|nr:hypothetical protein A6R68_14830 [Neotoma lepida]
MANGEKKLEAFAVPEKALEQTRLTLGINGAVHHEGFLIKALKHAFDEACAFSWLHQVKHLAQQIMEWQRLNAHGFHSFALLFVEVLQLIHGKYTVSIHIHAAEPILNARSPEHGGFPIEWTATDLQTKTYRRPLFPIFYIDLLPDNGQFHKRSKFFPPHKYLMTQVCQK